MSENPFDGFEEHATKVLEISLKHTQKVVYDHQYEQAREAVTGEQSKQKSLREKLLPMIKRIIPGPV